MASNMGISPVVVGADPLVSLGTSAPELGGVRHRNGRGSGESPDRKHHGVEPGPTSGLILGAHRHRQVPWRVAERVIAREIPIMIVLTIVGLSTGPGSQPQPRGGGGILLFLLAVYIAFTFTTAEEEVKEILEEVGGLTEDVPSETEGTGQPPGTSGSSWSELWRWRSVDAPSLNGATFLALAWGASELVIGLTPSSRPRHVPPGAGHFDRGGHAEPRRHRRGQYRRIQHLQPHARPGGIRFDPELRHRRVRRLVHELPAVLLLSVLVWPIATTAPTGQAVGRVRPHVRLSRNGDLDHPFRIVGVFRQGARVPRGSKGRGSSSTTPKEGGARE